LKALNLPDSHCKSCHLAQNGGSRIGCARVMAACLLNLSILSPWQACQAQTVAPASAPGIAKPLSSKPTPSLALSTTFSGLEWKALTPTQQIALKPLAGTWANLSDPQKRKWISLSANFALMTPNDQSKLHTRMTQWAALSPKEREQARLNFAEALKIAPEQKNEKWQAYQALPPEEKQKLATATRPKPPSTALAAQPVAPGKLNQVPLKKIAGTVGSPSSAVLAPGRIASAERPASTPPPAASDDTPKP